MTRIWSGARVDGWRPFFLIATGVIVVFIGWEVADVWGYYASRGELGQDWAFYMDLGRRWLDTGVLYGDRQLTGSAYHVLVNVDNLYPPTAILLFAPFALLPPAISAVVWWVTPIAAVVLAVVRLRPAQWTWPVMALCVFWPRTIGSLIVGNSDVLSAGFVAGGIMWGWPGVLGIYKPSFAPFTLAGSRQRSWWIGLLIVALASLPFVFSGAWGQYLTAARTWDLPWDRPVLNVPLLLIPVIAWVGRRPGRLSSASMGRDRP